MQSICYFLIPLYPLFILFIIASLAELNRAPFDLPEAEAELVAGYNVEYSSLPFALFFLAEYGNLFIVSNIIVLLFLGGTINSYNIFNYSISYIIKICIIISLFIIIRASFPRYRYDQLMKLG
jgi:NADH-quinone oxidoreductase subunit H